RLLFVDSYFEKSQRLKENLFIGVLVKGMVLG
ncbi:unnamed protein product, partial [marine sediment metagenome]